jgi:hypothetical protein
MLQLNVMGNVDEGALPALLIACVLSKAFQHAVARH